MFSIIKLLKQMKRATGISSPVTLFSSFIIVRLFLIRVPCHKEHAF